MGSLTTDMSDKQNENPRHSVADLCREANVQNLIQAQVARAPQSVALICGETQMTYGELNRRANQLAHYLRRRGVKPETLVGLCVTRSLEMVIGILGILKAGGAYVPLDPSYPKDRLAFILDDAHAQIVVTLEELLETLPRSDMPALCLDRDWADIAQQPATDPEQTALPENLVYVIYTSGSTGKPKGVMITHANLYHFVRIACAAMEITANDVCLQTASINYALSVRQLMIPLCYGATIVVATAEQAHDPRLLFDLIKRRQVSIMDVVPSFWRACLQALSALPLDERQSLMDNQLRRMVSIGEPLLSDIPHKWTREFGRQTTLINIFGQTETTGVVATFPIPPDLQNSGEIVPIGRSVPETELYILDSKMQPVPAGTLGELCVSNPCLARGYLNRPELTAEKFVPNPFSHQPGARLYKTGDMARYRADGNIDYLGRGDYQVKIRGQRLELGELEAVLNEHPGVRACVAMARGENPDEKYLVAYIVPDPDANLTTEELQQAMKQRVPDYMVPSLFVFLDALPLTPNGKVDRLALPDPALATSTEHSMRAENIFVAPRNQLEHVIARMWQELLKVDRVGVHDDFFDLGGHSLLAVRLFARIEQELGIRIPITALFHAPTIASLVHLIERRDEQVISWSPVVPIRTMGKKPPFFGVHGQDGGILFWNDIVGYLPDDQPFYGVQAQGVDGIQPALTCIEDMATRYLQEICKVQSQGPYYLGGFSMGGEIAFEMARQLNAQGERVALLVMFDTGNPARAIRMVFPESRRLPTPVLEPNPAVSQFEIGRRKIVGHLRRLSGRDPGGKLAYLIHEFWIRVRRIGIYTLVKLVRLSGKRLPDGLLLLYLQEAHTKALQNYVPGLYTGKITLFRASETLKSNPTDSPMGWEPLTTGGLEVHLFDSTHRIVDLEYADAVARQLTACLAAARGE